MDLVTCEAPLDNSFQKDRRELVNKGSLGRRRKPSRSNLRHILSPSSDQQDITGFSSRQANSTSFIKENGASNSPTTKTSTKYLNHQQEAVKTDLFHSKRSISNHLQSAKSNTNLTEASKNYREVIASINQLCNSKSSDFNGNNGQSILVSSANEDTISSFNQDVINSNIQQTKTESNISHCCFPEISGIRSHQVVTSSNRQDRISNKYNHHPNNKSSKSSNYQSSIAVQNHTTESRNNFQTQKNRNQHQTVATKNQQNIVTFSNHRQIKTSTPVPCKKPVLLNGRRHEHFSSKDSSKLYIESSLPRTCDETDLVADAQQFSIEAKLKRKKTDNQGRSAVLIQTWERRTQSETFSKLRKDSNTTIKNRFCDKENSDANSNAMPDSYICTKYKGSLQNGDNLKMGELVPNVRDINHDDTMLYRVSDDRQRRNQVSGTSGEVTVNGKSSVEEPEWISLSRKLCAKYVDEHAESHSPDSYPHEEPEGVREEPSPSHQLKTHSRSAPAIQRDLPKKQIIVVTPGVDGTSPTNEPPWIHLSRKLCNKFIEEHIEYPPITNGHFVEVPDLVEPNGDVRIIEKIGKPKGRKSKQKNDSVPEWVSLSKKLRAKFIESHIDDPDTIALDNQLNASDPEETGSESMSDVSQEITAHENVRKHSHVPDYRDFSYQSQEKKVEYGNNRDGHGTEHHYRVSNSLAFPEKECCWEYQEMEFDQESNSGTFQEPECSNEPLQEVRIQRGSLPEDSLEPNAFSFEKFSDTHYTPECYNNDVKFAPRFNQDESRYTEWKDNASAGNRRNGSPPHNFSGIRPANWTVKSSSSSNKSESSSGYGKSNSSNSRNDSTTSNKWKDNSSVCNYEGESNYTQIDVSCKNWNDKSLYTRKDRSPSDWNGEFLSNRKSESSSNFKEENQFSHGKNESSSFQKDESSRNWKDESQSERWKKETSRKEESQSDRWKDETSASKKEEPQCSKWKVECSSSKNDDAQSTYWNDVVSSKGGQQNKLITVQFIAHENSDRKIESDKSNYARRYKDDQKHDSFFNLSTWEEAHYKDEDVDGQPNSEKGSLSKEFKSKSLDNLCDSLDERLIINIKQSCKAERRNSLNSAISEENGEFLRKELLQEGSLSEQDSDVFFHENKQNSKILSEISSVKDIDRQSLESGSRNSENDKTSPNRPHRQHKKQNSLSGTYEKESSSDDEVFDFEPNNKKCNPPISEERHYGKINNRKSPVSEKQQEDKKRLNNERVKSDTSSKSGNNFKCNGMIPNSIYSGLPENKDSFSSYHQEEKPVQIGYKEPAKLGMSKWITVSKSEQNVSKNEYSNVQALIKKEQRNHSKSSKSENSTKENKSEKNTNFGEKYVNNHLDSRLSKGSISPNNIEKESKNRYSSVFDEEAYSNTFNGSVKEFDLKHKCKSFCDISYNSNNLRDESSFRHHESVADIASASKTKKSSKIEFQHFDFDSEIPLCAKLVSNQDKKKLKKISSASSSVRAESPCPSESSHVYEDMFKETPSGPSDSEASSWVMKNNSYYVNGRSSSMNDLDYSDSCSMSVKCDYASSSENSTLQSRHSSYASSSFYVNLRDYDSHMLEPSLNKTKKDNAKSATNLSSSISKSNPPTPESLRHLFTSPLSSIHPPGNRNTRLINRMPSDPQSHYYSTAAATSSAFKHGFAVTPSKPKKTERSSSIKIKDIAQGIILTFKRFQNHSKNSNVSPTHYVDVSHLAEMNGNSDAGKSKKNQKDTKGKQDKTGWTENGKTDTDSGFLSDVQRAKARRSSSDLTGMRSNTDLFNQDKKKSKSSKKNSNREKGKKNRSKASEPRTVPTVSRKVQQMADGTLYLVTTVSGDTTLPGVYSDSPDTSSELSCHKPTKQASESNC